MLYNMINYFTSRKGKIYRKSKFNSGMALILAATEKY